MKSSFQTNHSHTAARPVFFLIQLLFLSFLLFPARAQHLPYLQYLDDPWVDSVLSTLSFEEKVAQTLWMNTGTDRSVEHYIKLDRLVREVGIGGVVLTGSGSGSSEELADLATYYRSISRIPVAVATGDPRMFGFASGDDLGVHEDLLATEGKGEGGRHFVNVPGYPGPQALQAIGNDTLLTRLALHWSLGLTRLESQVLLAPVRDFRFGEVFRSANQLLSAKYQPGADAPKMERALSEITGFSSMIAADAAMTAGLAACFEPDVIREDRFAGEIRERLKQAGVNEAVITQRARMVLAFKYWAGLSQQHPAATPTLPALPHEIAERTPGTSTGTSIGRWSILGCGEPKRRLLGGTTRRGPAAATPRPPTR